MLVGICEIDNIIGWNITIYDTRRGGQNSECPGEEKDVETGEHREAVCNECECYTSLF